MERPLKSRAKGLNNMSEDLTPKKDITPPITTYQELERQYATANYCQCDQICQKCGKQKAPKLAYSFFSHPSNY